MEMHPWVASSKTVGNEHIDFGVNYTTDRYLENVGRRFISGWASF